jgi:methylmalonyl-CoA/ethylmalonyl-CoA epimerase
MTLGRLNHVGVATPSIAASIAMYRDLLGAEAIGEPFDLPAQGVKVCFIDAPNTQIELIEPYDDSWRRTRRVGSIICASRWRTFPPLLPS